MEVQHHIDRQQRRHWRGADSAFHMGISYGVFRRKLI